MLRINSNKIRVKMLLYYIWINIKDNVRIIVLMKTNN